MRNLVLVLLALLMVPVQTTVLAKHLQGVHNKVSEHGHKKRMKKAAKQDPGAKKHGHFHH